MAASDNQHSPVIPALTGMFGAFLVLLSNWVRWYMHVIPSLDLILIHLAKVGGLVITFYSIRILHRNWRTGKNSIDPETNKNK
jgi:hypothetical protein